jgi:purine nucleosidase
MVGWDISRKHAVFPPDAAEELRALGPLGAFSVDIQRRLIEFALTQTRLAGFDLPDPIAMAVALDPSVATDVRRVHVTVDQTDDLTRGQTVIDHEARSGPPNADVVFDASRERFLALLRAALRP